MSVRERISQLLERPNAVPDCWCAVGCRITFANPILTLQNYPQAWSSYYEAHNLRFDDPAVRWGYANTGTCRWSDLAETDTAGIFAAAAEHGLRYGLVVSEGPPDAPTLGFFARPDRELSAEETETAIRFVQEFHAASAGIEMESEAELRHLRHLHLPEFYPPAQA